MSKINFTRKCILMSVISQEKNLILVNSFNNIPFVKLYTTNSYYDIFIYSKIKGALCFFVNKDPNEKLFYLRIYDIKNYTMVFNIELKKEHLKYFIQFNDNFYFLQLRESLLGFQFNSKQNGKNFYQILNSEPNKDILEVNEKSTAIKPKDLVKTINKVNESIKTQFRTKLQINTKKGGGFFSKKVENFPEITFNDKKGEYFDLSNIPKVYRFFNNVEISDVLKKMVVFPDKKLPKNVCQNFITKYDDSFDFNSKTAPLKIIEKDFLNISNKEIYINTLVNHMIGDMKMHERLDIFKKEHMKRIKKKAGYKLGKKKALKPRRTKDFSIRSSSRAGSEFSMIEAGYFSDSNNNDARTSISSNAGLSGIYSDSESQPKQKPKKKQKKKDKFSEDRKSINELNTVALENIIDSDEDENKEAGFTYFAEEKKKPIINQKKTSSEKKELKKSISSDDILGKQKDKSKKNVKKAKDIMNFLGGDSVAIPEMDEDEGENRNSYLNTDNSKNIKTTTTYNFKNKINISSKTSLTGFLMTTNKLGKSKK